MKRLVRKKQRIKILIEQALTYLTVDSNVLRYVGDACHRYIHIIESRFRRAAGRQRGCCIRGRRGLRIDGDAARCRSDQFLYRPLRLLLIASRFRFLVRMR